MPVHVAGDLHWLNHCFEVDQEKHIHNSCFLLAEDRILIDTGAHVDRRAIIGEVDTLTDGDGVEKIIVTHEDLPHVGNLRPFVNEWGAELISSSSSPADFGFGEWGNGVRRAPLGLDMEINNRRLHVLSPSLGDKANSMWVFDYRTQTLFAADAYGNYHAPGACQLFFDALDDVSIDEIKDLHRDKVPWLRYVHADEILAVMREELSQYDISYVAPVHGNVLPAEELDRYLKYLLEAITSIYEEYPARETGKEPCP